MTLADTSPRFIETIRYADGRLHLLDLHTDRMRATRREVYGIEGPDSTHLCFTFPLISPASQ